MHYPHFVMRTTNTAVPHAPQFSTLVLLLTAAFASGCATHTPPRGVSSVSTAAPDTKATPQRDWSDAIIYFVMVDRFADGNPGNDAGVDRHNPGGWHGGDFEGLETHLDEIASLGATVIWLTPVVRQIAFCAPATAPPETRVGSFEHCGFHGYWAEDFTSIDPHLGTEAELAHLVAAAHQHGLKVLLDVVYNHTGYGSHYLADPATRSWFHNSDVSCDVAPLTCRVGGLPDLRTELPEVQDYLLDAHLGLARRTGVDGFRLDTMKHVDHAFWQRHRRETRARLSPDFFLLAEVWGGSATVLDEYFANDEADAGFDFTFRGECRGFVEGKGRTIAYASYLEKRQRVRPRHYLAHYLSSHDEPLLLHELNGDEHAFRLCVALQMTSVGIPVIFYGEEVARAGSVWPLNRGDMPWGANQIAPGAGLPRNESMRRWYQQLIAIRRAHPAVRTGTFRSLSTEGDLLVFLREDVSDSDLVIVAVNRGAAAASAVIPRPAAWPSGMTPHDALSGDALRGSAGQLDVTVPARSVRVYVGS